MPTQLGTRSIRLKKYKNQIQVHRYKVKATAR